MLLTSARRNINLSFNMSFDYDQINVENLETLFMVELVHHNMVLGVAVSYVTKIDSE